MTLDFSETYQSYWFDSASLYRRRSWLPRHCVHTGESLWLKPCVKGVTEYYMRSGAKRRDVRWISEQFWFEQRLRYKGK